MNIVSAARKLIFRPEAGAPVVQFPEGAIISNYSVNSVTPSVIVCNGTENPPSWQGVDHDSGVVIVNEVPEGTALVALKVFENGSQTNKALAEALRLLVECGCRDQYTTKLSFVETKLSPAGRMLNQFTGIVKRDDRDLTPVWREGGHLYVDHKDGARLIQPDILQRTYRNPDGSEIDLNAIPQRVPENASA